MTTRLGELLRKGQGLLLDLTLRSPLQPLASHWSDRIIWAADATPDFEEAAYAASRWFGKPL